MECLLLKLTRSFSSARPRRMVVRLRELLPAALLNAWAKSLRTENTVAAKLPLYNLAHQYLTVAGPFLISQNDQLARLSTCSHEIGNSPVILPIVYSFSSFEQFFLRSR